MRVCLSQRQSGLRAAVRHGRQLYARLPCLERKSPMTPAERVGLSWPLSLSSASGLRLPFWRDVGNCSSTGKTEIDDVDDVVTAKRWRVVAWLGRCLIAETWPGQARTAGLAPSEPITLIMSCLGKMPPAPALWAGVSLGWWRNVTWSRKHPSSNVEPSPTMTSGMVGGWFLIQKGKEAGGTVQGSTGFADHFLNDICGDEGVGG